MFVVEIRCKALEGLAMASEQASEASGPDQDGVRASLCTVMEALELVWGAVQAGSGVYSSLVLQLLAALMAIRTVNSELRELLGGPRNAVSAQDRIDRLRVLLACLHTWAGRVSVGFPRVSWALEVAAKGSEHLQRWEDLAVLDGCWAILGLVARPGTSVLTASPAALSLMAEDAACCPPWQQLRNKSPSGGHVVALPEAAGLMLSLLRAGMEEALSPAEKLLERACAQFDGDAAWAGPFRAQPSPAGAGAVCYAASLLLLEPLWSYRTASKRSAGKQASKARMQWEAATCARLWRSMSPCMWMASPHEPPPPHEQSSVLAAAVYGSFEHMLQKAPVTRTPLVCNPSWTLKMGALLVLLMPHASPNMCYSLRATPLCGAQGPSDGCVPLMPYCLAIPPQDVAHRAHCCLITAAEHLQYGMATSPARAAEAIRQRAGTPGAAAFAFPQPVLGFALSAMEAVNSVYFEVTWTQCEGYPSPLLLLDIAERAALVGCGVIKRWHLPIAPRRLAVQHLAPLHPLLSTWAFSPEADISKAQRQLLQVGSCSAPF
eukprot:jgi/Tetstr1/425300/TSEL_015751.t1